MPFHGETLQKWANGLFVSSLPKIDPGQCIRIWIPVYSRSQVSIYRTIGPLDFLQNTSFATVTLTFVLECRCDQLISFKF